MLSHKNLMANITHSSREGDRVFPADITEQCMFQKKIAGLSWVPPYHDLVMVTCVALLRLFFRFSYQCINTVPVVFLRASLLAFFIPFSGSFR